MRVQYYAGTYDLQPITAHRPIDGIGRLLTGRAPDWQAWDVAPPISLQIVSFIVVVVGVLRPIRAAKTAKSILRDSIGKFPQLLSMSLGQGYNVT